MGIGMVEGNIWDCVYTSFRCVISSGVNAVGRASDVNDAGVAVVSVRYGSSVFVTGVFSVIGCERCLGSEDEGSEVAAVTLE
jgi:hypothetical protein